MYDPLSAQQLDGDHFHSYYHYYFYFYYNYYRHSSRQQPKQSQTDYTKYDTHNYLLQQNQSHSDFAHNDDQRIISDIANRSAACQLMTSSNVPVFQNTADQQDPSIGLQELGQNSLVEHYFAPASSDLVAPEAAAAYAMIRIVRLILVILIGILVIKLVFLRKSDQNKQKQSRDNTMNPTNRSTKFRNTNQKDQVNRNANETGNNKLDRGYLSKLKLPPGPLGLPFLGYLPFMSQEIHVTLTELSQRYGPIYQIYLGGIRVVVLNDASLVRQAFRQPVFSGRPDTQLTRILQGYGIVNSDGALWREQRAFLHSALRKLGAKSLMNGSNGLEAKIQNQVKEFVNDLSEHAVFGKSCQVRPIVARAVSSVVGSIVMNLTYRKEKEKFDRLIELMQEGFRLFAIAMPLDFIPIFRFLPGVSYAYKKIKKNRTETSAFFKGFADEHRKYLSENFDLGLGHATESSNQLHPNRNWTNDTQQQATASQAQQPTTQTAKLANELNEDQESSSNNNFNKQLPQQQQVSMSSLPTSTGDLSASSELCNKLSQQKQCNAMDGTKSKTQATSEQANNSKINKKQVELDQIVARDLVDAYIIQQKRHENDGKENYFSDKQLVQIMSDIFSAGLETVTSTIEWSILFMILNPDCQKQVQQEIDEIIGRDRMPQLDDLARMPYTEATIYEVLRRSNVVALGNAHAALDDASIGGYFIPKGTQILPNLYGINMNSKLWNDPAKFDPTRFILNNKAQKPDFFIPFSVGRRVCLGDLLAKMEVFLFLVGLLQKFDLSVAHEDRQVPPKVEGTVGLSNAPVSFRVALQSRSA